MLRNSFGTNYEKEIHENERLKACDDKHRTLALEHLFLNYQFFITKEKSEDEAKKRQKELWNILDNYYKKLPDKSKETESDKTWRLYSSENGQTKDEAYNRRKRWQILISLNPEIDPELKEYSETSLEKSSAPMKYTSLNLWAYYKIKNDEKYKTYEQYERNPKLAFKEVEEIISKLKIIKRPNSLDLQHSEDESFYPLQSIHSYKCLLCFSAGSF